MKNIFKKDVTISRNIFGSLPEIRRKMFVKFRKLQKCFVFHSPSTHVFISVSMLFMSLYSNLSLKY